MGTLFLIGFMGVGKSTVGRLLARRLKRSFIDLDEQIIVRAGQTIPQIFAAVGEPGFRVLETEVLSDNAACRSAVVATGGGIVGRPENWQLMRSAGTIVYLHADWPTLQQRLVDLSQRPLAQDGANAQLQALWRQRLPLYRQADFVIDTQNLTAMQVVETLIKRLEADPHLIREESVPDCV